MYYYIYYVLIRGLFGVQYRTYRLGLLASLHLSMAVIVRFVSVQKIETKK